MATIRFNVSEDTNNKLMQIKGDIKKLAFAEKLFEKAVNAEHKKQNRKPIGR